MTDEIRNNKLDEKIKQTLSNYEAPYDPADWEKMESMLGTAPKASNFKWNTVFKTLTGVAVLVCGYFIYSAIQHHSPAVEKKDVSKPVQPAENTVSTPATINSTSIPTTSPVITPAQPTTTANENAAALNTNSVTETEAPTITSKEKEQKNEKALTDKKANKKMKDSLSSKDTEPLKSTPVMIMGNEPVFGDMLDSSKGIIRESHEKPETKKAAQTQSQTDYNIGWNKFVLYNVSPDSIKKHRDQMKKDSLKSEKK